MELPNNSIAELQLDLEKSESRLAAVSNEVRQFLEATGARTLPDALERYRRFAQASIDLTKRIETLEHDYELLQKLHTNLENSSGKTNAMFARTRVDLSQVTNAHAKIEDQLRGVRSTLDLCEETLESPMLAHFTKDLRQVLAAIRSAKSVIKPDTTEVESETDA